MKSLNLKLIVLSLIVFSCGENKNKKINESTTVKISQLMLEEEINSIDSLSLEFEAAKSNIEESIKKLDELINELE